MPKHETIFSDSIVESLPGTFYLIDAHGKFLRWNKNLEKVTGYSSQEVEASSPLDFFEGAEKDLVRQRIEDVFTYGSAQVEADLVSKEGKHIPYYFTGVRIRLEDSYCLVGLGQDITARKRTEMALADSEMKLRTIFDAALDGILVVDIETRKFVMGNRRMAEMLGVSPEDITELGIEDIHPKESVPQVLAKFERIVSKETAMARDVPVQKKDGSIYYVDITNSHISFEGKPCILGIFRDITEQKKAEEQHRSHLYFLQSLKRIDTIIRQSTNFATLLPDILDVILNIFDCDRAWLLFPCDPDSATVTVPMERTRDPYPGAFALGVDLPMTPEIAELLKELLHTSEPLILDPDSGRSAPQAVAEQFTIRSMIAQVIYPKIGAPWLFGLHQCSHARLWTKMDVVLFKEIGRRVSDSLSSYLSLNNLKESEAKFRSLFEMAGVGKIEIDSSGRMLRVNKEFCQMMGYSADELLHMTIPDITIGKDEKEASRIAIGRLFSGEINNFEIEKRYQGKGGRIVWCHINSTRIQDEKGSPVALGMIQDITSRKKIEEDLLKAKIEAEAANLAKSTFLANMSHEIRTPLTSILGFADLLVKQGGVTPEGEKLLKVIQKNGRHLFHIVSDILDLAKIEADQVNIEKIIFPIEPLLEDERVLLDLKAREKGIALRFEPMGPVPEQILSDPTRLKQILSNVVGNAIKFTDQGEVSLRYKLIPAPERGVALMEFIVTDTGPGLTDEQKKRLFLPFSQGDSSMTRKFGGTGLGLVLARQLARALGGDLQLIDSRPGAGSTFRFTIGACLHHDVGCPPVCWLAGSTNTDSLEVCPSRNIFFPEREKPVKKESAAKKEGIKKLAGKRVLLVEDSPDNLYLLNCILSGDGAQMGLASNGQEAVNKALSEEYDVVLMDIQMPVMGGYEATALLRERGYQKPIIALTAHALWEEREKALLQGFNDYVTKPIDPDELVRKINEICEIKKSA